MSEKINYALQTRFLHAMRLSWAKVANGAEDARDEDTAMRLRRDAQRLMAMGTMDRSVTYVNEQQP